MNKWHNNNNNNNNNNEKYHEEKACDKRHLYRIIKIKIIIIIIIIIIIKFQVFWDVTPRRLVNSCWRFGGT